MTPQQKGLNTRIKKLKEEITVNKEAATELNKRLAADKKTLVALEQELDRILSAKEPRVSEHAMLRYCERVLGVDLEDVKSQILTPQTAELMLKLGGGGEYPGDGFRIICKDYVITTII